MGISSRFSTPNEDALQKQAADLVFAAVTNAKTMFVPLLDKFPILQEANVEHWDFIVTVAGVFIAATRLHGLRRGDTREEELMEIVAESLAEWDPDGIRGFEDCKSLFESEFDHLTEAGHGSQFVSSDSIGKWIVWNALGSPPETQDECTLVRTVGMMVTHAFFNWWE